MPLSGSLQNTTPVNEQSFRLSLDFDSAQRLLEFRNMLMVHTDFSDAYALVNYLINEARKDIEAEAVTANVPGAPTNLAIDDAGLVTWDDMQYAAAYEV